MFKGRINFVNIKVLIIKILISENINYFDIFPWKCEQISRICR